MNAFSLSYAQISAILGRQGYFRDLGDETLQKLAAGARQISIRRDEAVYARGDPADHLYVVVGGQVKLFLAQPNGGEKVVALVQHGESFGIAPLWLGLPHPAHAVAKSDSHLLLLDRTALMAQARRVPLLAERMLTDLSQRFMDLMRDLESCTPRSSLQRVSCYLLQHSPEAGMGGYDILLPSTKRDIAAKLNLTQETLSRTFQALAKEGAIEVQGRMIRVLDSRKLLELNRVNCPPAEGIPD